MPKHRLSARDSYDRTIGGRITGRRDGRERRGGVGGGGVKSVMSSNVKTFQCLSDCICLQELAIHLNNVKVDLKACQAMPNLKYLKRL